ncbi:hypothetical protein BG006_008386 [Podila minutissima]|uniref:Uncharacterized protein n=1 Tax=Podila minutissima TaxID=64525 RepID=A0A9P5VK01_9FUNG|nr:hypothetical protein BG006_008386 [Podila minutissima]
MALSHLAKDQTQWPRRPHKVYDHRTPAPQLRSWRNKYDNGKGNKDVAKENKDVAKENKDVAKEINVKNRG